MAEFQEVVKQWQRMCRYYSEHADKGESCCTGCGLQSADGCPTIYGNEEIDTEKVERIVMKWAKEHPEPKYPTLGEWLRSIGLAYHRMIDPIPADIAQKLGLEPKKEG